MTHIDDVLASWRPHQRVKWPSRYDDSSKWFTGTIVRVIGDRVIVKADPDGRKLVLPMYRIHKVTL